jgi:hypothetical protein
MSNYSLSVFCRVLLSAFTVLLLFAGCGRKTAPSEDQVVASIDVKLYLLGREAYVLAPDASFSSFEEMPVGHQQAVHWALAPSSDVFFHTSARGIAVQRAEFGSSHSTYAVHGVPQGSGSGIAVDGDAQQLFYGLHNGGLQVFQIDPQWGAPFALRSLEDPTAEELVSLDLLENASGLSGQIQVDPLQKSVFFRTWQNDPCDDCSGRAIWRVNYDGSGLARLADARLGRGLAIDHEEGLIYFTDGDPKKRNTSIMRMDVQGHQLETLCLLDEAFWICGSIALDKRNGHLYLLMSDPQRRRQVVQRVRVDGSQLEWVCPCPMPVSDIAIRPSVN